jgi:hypothetical protein
MVLMMFMVMLMVAVVVAAAAAVIIIIIGCFPSVNSRLGDWRKSFPIKKPPLFQRGRGQDMAAAPAC